MKITITVDNDKGEEIYSTCINHDGAPGAIFEDCTFSYDATAGVINWSDSWKIPQT